MPNRSPIVDQAVAQRAAPRLRWLIALLVVLLVLSLAGIGWSVWYALEQRDKAAEAGLSLAERIADACALPEDERPPAVLADPDLCDDADAVVEDAPGSVIQGPVGPEGPPGPPGLQGPPGAPGEDGADGRSGRPGEDGTSGQDGAPGADGEDGATGAQGPGGEAGPPGPQGPAGERGPAGPPGPQGPQGEQGPAGMTCPEGYQAQEVTVVSTGGPQTVYACVQQ